MGGESEPSVVPPGGPLALAGHRSVGSPAPPGYSYKAQA
ncbi:uncharacterized protein G2W53_008647 [Senna tora]|uniref:Uncharacterized protein n=1 Tax=Senna tora TaxID=362788 RepID=A0A835CHE5_9FABA|nr:uncharacterized protein G2W53_008647 [Senna tora]